MRRPSVLQINAVVLAVALTGCYVWFRSAQAQQHTDRVLPGSKIGRVSVHPPAATTSSSASSPATAPPIGKAVFYGSKSAPVELTPTLQITGNSEPPAIFENLTVTTAPTTQPIR
jgi:hypothetical protein